jgi:uncharacterized membrane protein YfcA
MRLGERGTRALFVLVIAMACLPTFADDKEEHDATEHKPLFPMNIYDEVGFFLMGSMTAIAAGGGIGGGGVLVPILILVMGFTIKAAIPLSSATILGGSIFHICRNIWRRHPKADRPLIDWNFIALMQPMLISGAVVGSFLNKMVPDWVLAILLFVILIFTAQRTYNNGMKKWRKEHEEITLRESLARSGSDVELEEQGPLTETSPELAELLEEDRHFPIFKVSLIMMVFVGVVALNVAKGSEAANFTPFDIKCGSTMFWVLSLGIIPWCLTFWYIIRTIVIAQYYNRVDQGWEFHDGDVEWTPERTIHYPMVAILSGLIAGMFGIGGGLINGPLMVELGFIPDVAAATGATMLLFTSTTSTIMYILFDLLNYSYAGPLMVLGFFCTVIGQQVFNRIMHAYKRDSLIIFVIAFIVFASAVLMGIEGTFVFIEFLKGEGAPVTGICEAVPLTKELSIDPDIHSRRTMLETPFSVMSLYY